MSSPPSTCARSWRERLFHAFLFEVLAIGLSAPLAAWVTGRGMADMGVLTGVLAFMALLWNMVFNWLFDRWQAHAGWQRTLTVRVGHAFLFELGLLIMAVPLIAWWMDVTLWHAVLVDIGLVLFYLPYTFFYNLAYDRLRARLLARSKGHPQPGHANS